MKNEISLTEWLEEKGIDPTWNQDKHEWFPSSAEESVINKLIENGFSFVITKRYCSKTKISITKGDITMEAEFYTSLPKSADKGIAEGLLKDYDKYCELLALRQQVKAQKAVVKK